MPVRETRQKSWASSRPFVRITTFGKVHSHALQRAPLSEFVRSTPRLACAPPIAHLAQSPASSSRQIFRDLLKAETVQHARLWHSAFAGHFNAPVCQPDLRGRMRIGVDAHHAAEAQRALMPPPV